MQCILCACIQYSYIYKVLSRYRKIDHTCVYDQRMISCVYIYNVCIGNVDVRNRQIDAVL